MAQEFVDNGKAITENIDNEVWGVTNYSKLRDIIYVTTLKFQVLSMHEFLP